jgi:hypothetical protein
MAHTVVEILEALRGRQRFIVTFKLEPFLPVYGPESAALVLVRMNRYVYWDAIDEFIVQLADGTRRVFKPES